MSQLLVGQPLANAGSTSAPVLPNHTAGRQSSPGNAGSMLTQRDNTPGSDSYAQLLAQLPQAGNTDNMAGAVTDNTQVLTLLAQLPQAGHTDNMADAVTDTPALADVRLMPAEIQPDVSVQAAILPAVTDAGPVYDIATLQAVVAENDIALPVAGSMDMPVPPQHSAEVLAGSAQLSVISFLPLPVFSQLRTEAMQPGSAGLPGFTDREYNPAMLNSSAYSNAKGITLSGADMALAMPASASLQHFIRQATDLARPLGNEAFAVGSITAPAAGTGSAPVATATEPAFQWKADQLGLQSSQWGQKLVHLLSDKINLQLGQQIQRAQIRLDPPQLGLIELSVSVDGDRTTVQLYASNNQMREAMQQNLEQLRQQLAQRLGSEQLLDIDVRQQAQQQSGQQQAAPEQIAAQFADDATEINSTPSERPVSGWLNRLV